MKDAGAMVNKSCGLHVHIGAEKFDIERIKNIVINYSRMQSLINVFLPRSRRANKYCKAIPHTLANRMKTVETRKDAVDAMNEDRYYAVNLMSYYRHKTIEFRQHSGTVEFEKIYNWIKFLTGLVKYSKNNRFSEDITALEDVPWMDDSLFAYLIERIRVLNR